MAQYNLENHKANLELVVQDAYAYFLTIRNTPYPSEEKRYLALMSVLNIVWQEWIIFWRYYYLALFVGGRNLHGSPIYKLTSLSNEQEILFYIKNVLVENRTFSTVCSLPYYYEKTWGDVDVLAKISNNILRMNKSIICSHTSFYDFYTITSTDIYNQLSNHNPNC